MDKYLFYTFSLQLLSNAVQTTLLNSTNNPGNDLSPEMQTFYDKGLLRAAGPELVHTQFAQKRSIPKNGGKSIQFRRFSSLPKATSALTEGVTPDGQTLNVTEVTVTVAQYGDYITLSDMLELTAVDNTIVETTKLLGQQGGRTMDTVTRNAICGGTNAVFSSTWSGTTETKVSARSSLNGTAVLKVEDIKRAVTKLKAANAPKINGDYVGIIHPYMTHDLTADPEWKDWTKYTDAEHMYEGEIGKIWGVRFVETSEAKIINDNTCPTKTAANTEAGTAAVYYSVFCTLIFGENAYGAVDIAGQNMETIVKPKGSAGSADPLNQRSSVGWKAAGAGVLLLPEYLVRVESCSAYNPTAAAN